MINKTSHICCKTEKGWARVWKKVRISNWAHLLPLLFLKKLHACLFLFSILCRLCCYVGKVFVSKFMAKTLSFHNLMMRNFTLSQYAPHAHRLRVKMRKGFPARRGLNCHNICSATAYARGRWVGQTTVMIFNYPFLHPHRSRSNSRLAFFCLSCETLERKTKWRNY